MRLFVFGLGYSAQHLGSRLIAEGWQVAGTSRTAAGCAALKHQGFKAAVHNDAQPLTATTEWLAEATHILVSVPPGENGDPIAAHYGEVLARLPGLLWLGYLSATSVYGDTGGAWVDETSPVQPSTPRGTWRARAEQDWLSLHKKRGVPVHIFRLPGIYGPGRSAIDTLRAGNTRRIYKPGQVFSRIHVDDLAAALAASMTAPAPGNIYNICDDEAAPPQDVTAYAATLLGLEPEPLTPFDEAELSPMARSFYGECKRVSNDKMKTGLNVRLQFPTYRQGLAAILDQE